MKKITRLFRKKQFLMAFFAFHFSIMILTNIDTSIDNIIKSPNLVFTAVDTPFLRKVQHDTEYLLFQHARSTVYSDLLDYYLSFTGTETGYGFFSPNVPSSYKLVFQLTFTNDSTQVVLPTVPENDIGLRMCNYYDGIGKTKIPGLRNVLIKAMTAKTIKNYTGVKSVTAIFGVIVIPPLRQFKTSSTIDYETLYTYNYDYK